ncbi:MAG TPA: hypothetical protein VNA14_04075 [Mycobacteriales bacterium]|nr:hypothetical protein [Mycobacteriales bacterium]
MRDIYANTATLIGRGLRAAVVPGCLSSTGVFGTTSTISAVPATHVFAATQAPNAMKRHGSHPPRATAALN